MLNTHDRDYYIIISGFIASWNNVLDNIRRLKERELLGGIPKA